MIVPEISQDDLLNFHARHFLGISVDHFSEHFLGPVEEEEQDDGLGYYDDGVQRTLTDEQIAMFRHSEIQAILRKRRHEKEAGINSGLPSFVEEDGDNVEDGEVEDEDEDLSENIITVNQPAATSKTNRQSRKKKRKKSKNKGAPGNQLAKPDLRKRTWDKVDEGLAGLDYDEATNAANSSQQLHAQRRRISYDDD
ncbi:hypothetical protein F5884DRAFT_327022 [Xylogone sp. PMI_703]|nr:hypothetical protein F5884DRAFT_327022 [Xylogone sp. PMI_703]